jgi:hypothetical protein
MRRGADHDLLGVVRNVPDCPRVAPANDLGANLGRDVFPNDPCDGVVLAPPKATARRLTPVTRNKGVGGHVSCLHNQAPR